MRCSRIVIIISILLLLVGCKPQELTDYNNGKLDSCDEIVLNMYGGKISFSIDHWSVWESYTDFSIKENDILDSLTMSKDDASAFLSVSIIVKNIDITDISFYEQPPPLCNCFELLPRMTAKNARGSVYTDKSIHLDFGILEQPVWFQEHTKEKSDNDYFSYQMPPEGESIILTLGFLLSDDLLTAATSGELYLACTLEWDSSSLETLNLLSLPMSVLISDNQ